MNKYLAILHFYNWHIPFFWNHFLFVRMWSLISMPDTAENRTLHDDGSIFQTLLLCLQVPEGEKGPFTSLLLIVWFPVARWRAQHTVGEERRPRLAQELAHSHFICLKHCDGFRLASLWSFVEIPNGDIWRCLSTVPFFFLSSQFFFLSPISSCYWHPCRACLFWSPHLSNNAKA